MRLDGALIYKDIRIIPGNDNPQVHRFLILQNLPPETDIKKTAKG